MALVFYYKDVFEKVTMLRMRSARRNLPKSNDTVARISKKLAKKKKFQKLREWSMNL